MAAMTSHEALKPNDILRSIERTYPHLRFMESSQCMWSPTEKTVYYTPLKSKESLYSLLHEAAHGILQHKTYSYDVDLLLKEVDAWEQAKQIAKTYSVKIDEDYLESAIDTYRDWLHERSTCPICQVVTLETKPQHYKCINCDNTWAVSAARFHRTYRMNTKNKVA
jgi:sulfur relay (sulfurtransferase) DsrC/TusE family protein